MFYLLCLCTRFRPERAFQCIQTFNFSGNFSSKWYFGVITLLVCMSKCIYVYNRRFGLIGGRRKFAVSAQYKCYNMMIVIKPLKRNIFLNIFLLHISIVFVQKKIDSENLDISRYLWDIRYNIFPFPFLTCTFQKIRPNNKVSNFTLF